MAQVQNGSYTSQQNLISLLRTFLLQLTSPWTIDSWTDSATPILEAHIGNVYIQLEGDQTDIAVYQSLGWSGAQAPGTQTDDSGNGGFGTNDRQAEAIGDAGGNYWFYAPLAGSENFVYVVLEYATGFYRHAFGFGDLIKANDYTGGEFCYGGNWDQSTNIDLADSGGHSVLLDHGSSIAGQSATVHVEGLTDEPSASTKWGVVTLTSAAGNDTAAVARWLLTGGVRGGPYAPLGFIKASLLDGLFPGIPIKVWTRHTGSTPNRWQLLGTQPYARVVQMGLLDAQDTFSVGGETWRVFPAARKVYITPEGTSGTEESWNLGIAYRES